jgi:hypothetical protein
LEHVIEIIKGLPVEDVDKLREVLNNEENSKHEKDEKLDWRLERYKKTRKWLDENSERYMNQWVCLEGDKLIAHGKDALSIHQTAIDAGIKSLFLHHIVEEPESHMGGW